MDAVAQHTCKGSRCDASPRNTPTDNATEGILLDCGVKLQNTPAGRIVSILPDLLFQLRVRSNELLDQRPT